MRFFNTAGPCDPDKHYMLPASARLPEARRFIDKESYFVVHAPRQTGKTTTLRALARELTAEGRYAALHFSCEGGEPAGEDYANAQRAVLTAITERSRFNLPEALQPPPWPSTDDPSLLTVALRAWAEACPLPLVLIFDEIDALRGASLLSVLRQLRAGYPDRPQHFPMSVILCGLRDVRDYKASSGGDPERIGTASPFNIKVTSERLRDFTAEEVAALYLQHTQATGQVFTQAALDRAFDVTQGQPWLVNALAAEIIEGIAIPRDRAIAPEHIDEAKERLILARATHLDSLVARLMEPRVRRVIGPVLEGALAPTDMTYQEDIAYVRDLGLIAPTKPVRIANPIYREVIVRVLAGGSEEQVMVDPRSFVLPDGRLDIHKFLVEFAAFWKQHGDILSGHMPYHEVAPQLVLMAFLQRVVNGGGYVDREYGVGRGRIDLCVRWPYVDAAGKRCWQREAIELKVWAPRKADPLDQGLTQLEGYLDGLGLDQGVLVIFDRRPETQPIEQRTRLETATTAKGHAVTVLRA